MLNRLLISAILHVLLDVSLSCCGVHNTTSADNFTVYSFHLIHAKCANMDPEKSSVVQNVAGEHHKVVGGNIIHGDAHFHIHGDTTSSKKDGKAEKVTSAGRLDPEVEVILQEPLETETNLSLALPQDQAGKACWWYCWPCMGQLEKPRQQGSS